MSAALMLARHTSPAVAEQRQSTPEFAEAFVARQLEQLVAEQPALTAIPRGASWRRQPRGR